MARRLVRDGAVAIVTAGGDGTINAVVNALAGIDVPLESCARTANDSHASSRFHST